MRLLKLGVLIGLIFCGFSEFGWSQKSGNLSGAFRANSNFFVRDSAIGAANTPQYDRQKFGGETWMVLNYRNWGFDIGVRFDAYLNSNLLDPQDSYSALGIGRWHIRKEFEIDKKKNHKLDISAGYLYGQIGAGTIFRAYEVRALAIDNALVGGRAIYKFGNDFSIHAFMGRQKKVEKQPNLFETYEPIIAGAYAEGFISALDSNGKGVTLVPGAGIVRRTLDDGTMGEIVSDISSYQPQDRFIPRYTSYAASVYNTLSWKGLTWYVEGAYKTHEAVNAQDPGGILKDTSGFNLYTTLSYSQKGFAISADYKYTKRFIYRTSPLQTLNRGQIAYLAPMARQNTYRLTARYNAATQEIGEQSLQINAQYTALKTKNHKLYMLVNYSNIFALDSVRSSNFSLDQNLLYRELYFEATYKFKRKWKMIGGIQVQQYNQEIYEVKPGVPIVFNVVPFWEMSYKLDKKKSLRFEAQYMFNNKTDYGSWAYALLEFNIAPRWSFTFTTMLNTQPKKHSNPLSLRDFYFTGLVSYTKGSSRFDLSFVRQVEGIVCTGGVCRYEPAFNGARFNITTQF